MSDYERIMQLVLEGIITYEEVEAELASLSIREDK